MTLDEYQVLAEVAAERARQDDRWGEQNHPSVWRGADVPTPAALCSYYGVSSEPLARRQCEQAFARGHGTYAHILVEEVAEAIAAGHAGEAALRGELVQVAAVAVAWIEAIDRRERRR